MFLIVVGVSIVLVVGAILLLRAMTPAPAEPSSTASQTPPVAPQPQTLDTSNWQTYRNDEFGFEVKYPPYLTIGKTLLQGGAFDPGLEGSIITSFSDERSAELVISVSSKSLDGYIVRNNPGGEHYHFDQETNRWMYMDTDIPVTEPRLMDTSVTAYGYKSGDIIWAWQGAVVPHPQEKYVLEFVLVRNIEEQQQVPDLGEIVDTIKFGFVGPLDTSTWQTYRNDEFGFELKYPKDWEFRGIKGVEDYIPFIWFFPSKSSNQEIEIAVSHKPLDQERAKRETGDIKYNYSKVTIGGRDGYLSGLFRGFEGRVKELLLDGGNGRTFIFSTQQDSIDTFDQILATFRFVE